MCGIVGFLRAGGHPRDERELLAAMLARIVHRGPDEVGYFADGRAALACARLDVIDPSGGHQPLSDPVGRTWIAYNGEIHNYVELREELIRLGVRMRTASDTEVILHAWRTWGIAAFARFDGGFAFALYDSSDGRLVLARDRFGERPLFYVEPNGGLAFASEIKALLPFPGLRFRFDRGQLDAICALWAPAPDRSPFEGVLQVPPGACITFEAGMRTVQRFASLPLDAPPNDLSESEAAEAVRSAVTDSVRLRLRSDAPVGVYLSGGIDSAIVATLVRELSSAQLRTFSIAFDDPRFDESREQAEVAAALGADHHVVRVGEEAIAEHYPLAVWHGEVPVVRTALVPMLLLARELRASGVKVALTGEGADEVFLGYDLFKEAWIHARWDDMDAGERAARLSDLFAGSPLGRSGAAMSSFWSAMRVAPLGTPSHEMRIRAGSTARRLLASRDEGGDPLMELVARSGDVTLPLDPIRRAQWVEFNTLLAGYLLSSQGDRMAFSQGVENRCPFLALAVVELAASLPVDLSLRDGRGEKHILREAFREFVPAAAVGRRKRPYTSPDAAVLLHPRSVLHDIVTEARLREIEGLDVGFALRLVAKLRSAPHAATPGETQALAVLTSIALLHSWFVAAQPPPLGRVTAPTVVDVVRSPS